MPMMDIPTSVAAMRAHLQDEHGADPGDMPMVEMQAKHKTMHGSATDHDHPGMTDAGRAEPAKKPMFDRALPVVSEMEFRAAADGGWDFTGYAALFDVESDASWMPWKESVDPVAFNRTLKARAAHTFVVNHDDGLLLASTRTDRLHLTPDSRGLLTEAKLPATSYANDVRELHAAGETRGMSFTFKPTKNGETWGSNAAGEMTRRLTDVQLGHVTIVTTLEPGYSATQRTVQFRALAVEMAAEVDDLEDLFDAIKEGRALDENAVSLLKRLTDHYQPSITPEPTTVEPGLDLVALRARADEVLAEHNRLIA